MKTISFIGNGEPPGKLLEIFRKMTPGRSGCWGQLKGIDNYNSDYYGVIDCLPSGIGIPENRCVFLGAHPPESHYAYKNMDNYHGLKMFDCNKTFGFGEWWIKYDYDHLNKLEPMEKKNKLCAIVSQADTQPYHKRRRAYLERFCNRFADKLNLHGRISPWGSLIKSYKGPCGSNIHTAQNNDHMSGKEFVYESHKYAIEFDAPGNWYFSERVFDCLLLWCYPIYNGCRNLHTFLPKECFSYLDIEGSGDDVMSIINSKIYENSLESIGIARNLLLNKYSLWPRIHEAIFDATK